MTDNTVDGAAPAALAPEFASARTWARIESGRVVEIASSAWDLRKHMGDHVTWIDATEATPVANVGGGYDVEAHTFSPPPPPVVLPKSRFSPLEFMGKLTPAEDTEIATAAQSNAQVLLWLLSMSSAQYIDVTDPRTVEGVNGLVAAKLLTADRGAALLAY